MLTSAKATAAKANEKQTIIVVSCKHTSFRDGAGNGAAGFSAEPAGKLQELLRPFK
jgi:hypothetical protein